MGMFAVLVFVIVVVVAVIWFDDGAGGDI